MERRADQDCSSGPNACLVADLATRIPGAVACAPALQGCLPGTARAGRKVGSMACGFWTGDAFKTQRPPSLAQPHRQRRLVTPCFSCMKRNCAVLVVVDLGRLM